MTNSLKRKELNIFVSWFFLLLISIIFMHMETENSEVSAVFHVEAGNNTLSLEKYGITIRGWEQNGVTFFFLPSFSMISRVLQNDQTSTGIIYNDDGTKLSNPMIGSIQDVNVDIGDGNMVPWRVGFLKSSNIYSLFINLNDADIDSIEHDNYISSELTVFSPHGSIELYEENLLIKGRGNSTWKAEKKPYEIKLSKKHPLCGLQSSSKWVLLANYYDDTKILNKMTMDLAKDMDMEYAIESNWVDVYMNGNYIGNYLLCQEPGIGEQNLNVRDLDLFNQLFYDGQPVSQKEDVKGYDYSLEGNPVPDGGYLFEKNFDYRYERKPCGFKVGDDSFHIKAPDLVSLEEGRYIKKFVEEVDKTIHDKGEGQLHMIDISSFSRNYLISELSLDPDAGFTSTFFYKKPNDNKLYAGPCWDYDMTYGRRAGSVYKDYTSSIFDIQEHILSEDGNKPLDWDKRLSENDIYMDYVSSVFHKYIPVFDKLLSSGIDNYHEYIEQSLIMDSIRWKGYDAYKATTYNAYRYLKFYLYNRLVNLSDILGEDTVFPKPDVFDRTYHILTFLYDDGHVEKMSVLDGTQMKQEDLPDFDHAFYDGWKSYDDSFSLLSYYDPIFEDRTLVLDYYEEKNLVLNSE